MKMSLARANRHHGVQVLVLLLTVVTLAVTFPSIVNASWLFGTLDAFALVGIVALGLGITMIAGELDMSVASMAALAGVVAIRLQDLGLVPSLLLATLAGVLIGLLQGYLINRLQISSLVLTIGTLVLLRGVSYVLSGDAPVLSSDFAASDILLMRWGILSPGILVAAAVFVVVGLFLALTRPGREIYAIGGARTEATAAGVPVRRTLLTAFALSGGCAALAGAMAAVRGSSAAPDAHGDLLVNALSVVLIGGISLYGGRGTVWNVVLGVTIVGALGAGMSAAGAPNAVKILVTGALLFTLILIQFFRGSHASRRRARAALASVARPAPEPARTT